MREKLIEWIHVARYDAERMCEEQEQCYKCPAEKDDQRCKAGYIADRLIANGVTVQEWISVKDRLPKMRDDGFADAFLVTDGNLAHIAYFVDGEWIFTDNGQMKEPMFYDVTHWLCLPQPPKGE